MSTLPRPAMRAGLAGTTIAHGLLVAAAVVAAHQAGLPAPKEYAVELVAAPDPSVEPLRHAAPEAVPMSPEETVPVVKAKPKPLPKKPPPKPTPPAKVHAETPHTRSDVTPLPNEVPSTGRDIVTVHQDGFQSQFQYYIDNIVRAIKSNFAPWSGQRNLKAEVAFTILRDGSVKDVRILSRSGQQMFDDAATTTISVAAALHAFGPLPAAYNGTELQISYTFLPPGQQ